MSKQRAAIPLHIARKSSVKNDMAVLRHVVMMMVFSLAAVGLFAYFMTDLLSSGRMQKFANELLNKYRAPLALYDKIGDDLSPSGTSAGGGTAANVGTSNNGHLTAEAARRAQAAREAAQVTMPDEAPAEHKNFYDPNVLEKIEKMNVSQEVKQALIDNYMQSGVFPGMERQAGAPAQAAVGAPSAATQSHQSPPDEAAEVAQAAAASAATAQQIQQQVQKLPGMRQPGSTRQ